MHGIQPYTNLGDPNDKAYKIYKASDTGEVFSPVSEVQDTEKIAKLPEQLKVASMDQWSSHFRGVNSGQY